MMEKSQSTQTTQNLSFPYLLHIIKVLNIINCLILSLKDHFITVENCCHPLQHFQKMNFAPWVSSDVSGLTSYLVHNKSHNYNTTVATSLSSKFHWALEDWELYIYMCPDCKLSSPTSFFSYVWFFSEHFPFYYLPDNLQFLSFCLTALILISKTPRLAEVLSPWFAYINSYKFLHLTLLIFTLLIFASV